MGTHNEDLLVPDTIENLHDSYDSVFWLFCMASTDKYLCQGSVVERLDIDFILSALRAG
jgi:hypothetical protein